MEEEYMLQQDNDGHWYVIPSNKEEEFCEWLDGNPDDEEYWTEPDFAVALGGSYTMVKFKSYRID